jgi:phenylalanine ammonia-lyase
MIHGNEVISPTTLALYEAVRDVVGCPPSPDRPYIRNDNQQSLDMHIAAIAANIAAEGIIPQAVNGLVSSLR